jgi:flagellar hook-associated protein 3 FlgL
MRVTDGMSYRLMQTEISQINDRLLKFNQQAATGKKFESAADNPAAVRQILDYRVQITANERFGDNAQRVCDRLANTESQLSNVCDILQEARVEAVRAENGGLQSGDREQIATVIQGLREELLTVANTTVGGQYIFAGYQNSSQPFSADAAGEIQYSGDSQVQEIGISPGELISQSLPGDKVFLGREDTDGDGLVEQDGTNIFQTLANLERSIRGHAGQVYNQTAGEYTQDTPTADLLGYVGADPPTLEHDGQPIDLSPVKDTNGDLVSIGDLSTAQRAACLRPDSADPDALTDTVLGKTVYMHADGSLAEFNTDGQPVLVDADGDMVQDDNGDEVVLLDGGSALKLQGIDGISAQLADLDQALDHVRTQRSYVGVTMQRVEGAVEDREQAVTDLKGYLSSLQDVDLAEVSTNIVQQETALRAAMSVTSRLSQISILDYLG